MTIFCFRLVESGESEQLRGLCKSLHGPPESTPETENLINMIQNELGTGSQALDSGGNGITWHSKLMGSICKRSLLRDVVIPAMSRNRSLQSLVVEYVESHNSVMENGLKSPLKKIRASIK